MEITLEAVEKVMEQTGVDYKAAKEALTKTDGDVDAAIKLIQPDTKDLGEDIKEVMDKLRKKLKRAMLTESRSRKAMRLSSVFR